jgi:hypothetical protein
MALENRFNATVEFQGAEVGQGTAKFLAGFREKNRA